MKRSTKEIFVKLFTSIIWVDRVVVANSLIKHPSSIGLKLHLLESSSVFGHKLVFPIQTRDRLIPITLVSVGLRTDMPMVREVMINPIAGEMFINEIIHMPVDPVIAIIVPWMSVLRLRGSLPPMTADQRQHPLILHRYCSKRFKGREHFDHRILHPHPLPEILPFPSLVVEERGW